MKSVKEIKLTIKQLKVESSNEIHSRVLNKLQNRLDDAKQQYLADTSPNIWRIIMNSKITKYAAAAVILIAVMIGINQFGGSIDGTSVAWAEVMRNFKQQLQTNDYIHLVITNRKPLSGDDLGFGDVIKKEEIWVQRPFNMRIEEVYQENDVPDYITFTPTTSIYNEEGEFHFSHNKKSWTFRDADVINVKHRVPYRELRKKWINDYLTAKYYAKFNWEEGTYNNPYGRSVDNTELDGDEITIYEFSEYEGKRHRCWLRDKDDRLLRMEVYTENERKPVEIYEVLSYEAPLNEHFFEALIPKDYVNSQLWDYENQPQLINPQVATVVTDEGSAKFYRLNTNLGQTPEDVIGIEEPVFEIYVKQPQQVTVKIKQPAESNDSKPYTWSHRGIGLSGNHCYGVQLDRNNNSEKGRIVVMPAFDYKDQGQIVFEFLDYQTDYTYCKAAFDADGDGQMDVWCQVPSEEVVSAWRQTLTKD